MATTKTEDEKKCYACSKPLDDGDIARVRLFDLDMQADTLMHRRCFQRIEGEMCMEVTDGEH